MDAGTGDRWHSQLRAGGRQRDAALHELRPFLANGLRRSLGSRSHVDEAFVDDIAQEASIRVLERLDSFEGRSRFTTWAMSIAVRLALTELRRKRYRNVSFDELVPDGRLLSAEDEGSSHADGAMDRARILQVLRAVIQEELTERQRLAIRAELEGMPMSEIARHMESNRNAIYKLTHDARKRLGQALQAKGFEAEQIRQVFRF